MSNCFPCRAKICADSTDYLTTYSLTDSLVFNGVALSFVVECPAGVICPPGAFPQTVVYPAGTFVLPVPQNPTPGFPIVLSMMGCQSLVTITLPSGSSASAIAAAANSIILQVAAQQAECDTIPSTNQPQNPNVPGPVGPTGTTPNPNPSPPPNPAPAFFNQEVSFVQECPVGDTLEFTGALPSWIFLGSDALVGAAGTFGGATQAEANTTAQAILNDFGNAALVSGELTCAGPSCLITTNTPLPEAIVYQAYSTFLAATFGTAPYTWELLSGTIPGGGSITAGGEIVISPGPSAEDTETFTIKATDSTPGTPKTCTKEFTLTIGPAADCPIWGNMSWGNGDIPIITFTPSSSNGNSFSCTITAPALSTGGTSQDGTIAYSGDGCSNCHLAFSMSASGGAYIEVNLKFNGATAFSWNTTSSSSVDQIFAVHPAYTSISIQIVASVGGAAGGNGSLSGTISTP